MEVLTLGEKIRRKRKSLGLTLKSVAGNNVTPAQLSYVESDKCKPSMELLHFICQRLELDMDYLLESEEEQAKKYCDNCMREYEFYKKIGQLEDANKRLDEVDRISCKYNIVEYAAAVQLEKGQSSLGSGDLSSAQCSFLYSLQLFMKLNDWENISKCYIGLGIIDYKRRYFDDALIFLLKGLKAIKSVSLHDKTLLWNVLFNISKVYYSIGNEKEAQKYIRWSLKEMDILGQSAKYVIVYEALINAMVSIRHGEYETCISHTEQVMKYLSNERNLEVTQFLFNIVKHLIINGYENYCDNILNKLWDSIQSTELVPTYLYFKSVIYKEIDDKKSEKYLIESVNKMKDMEFLCPISIETLFLLGKHYNSKMNYSKAFETFQRGLKLLLR